MKTGRLEAFSDGVLAIIITIMVLELKVPEGSNWADLKLIFPKFISYILSFIYIGLYWNNHHHLLHAVHRVNGKVLWANLILLFTLSLIPFTTAWMGQNQFDKHPVALYGINLFLSALAYLTLEKTALSIEGADSKLKIALQGKSKEYLSPLIYLIGIMASFFLPWIGLVCFVTVAIIWIIPDRRIEKALNE